MPGFKRYAYLDHRLGCYILSVDHARFINHSEDPNVSPDFSRERHGVGVATQDIQAGDEITIDYRLIEKDNWLSK
jgi:SET domain-containing protein